MCIARSIGTQKRVLQDLMLEKRIPYYCAGCGTMYSCDISTSDCGCLDCSTTKRFRCLELHGVTSGKCAACEKKVIH